MLDDSEHEEFPQIHARATGRGIDPLAVLGCSIVARLGRADEEFGFQESEHLPFQFRGGIEVLETEESLRDVIPVVRIELQVFDGSLAAAQARMIQLDTCPRSRHLTNPRNPISVNLFR